ncbi:hypothetical protein ACMGDH_11000 [Sphingomonas sp. DT-207]|uniref:hypothetical protein n=1 Tax=Sphingomonas sp. DT-207 TaxID=3396167 RepID=UPI003F1D99C7
MSEELTPLERAVVALSRQDPISSLRSRGRKRGWILGLPPGPLPLANPRLEALRQYAIVRRVRGSTGVEAERGQLWEAGFSCKKIEEINDLVDQNRPEKWTVRRMVNELFVFGEVIFRPRGIIK